MSLPILSTGIFICTIFGACCEMLSRGPASTFAIWSRICFLPALACSSPASARASYERALASDARAAVPANNLAWIEAEKGGSLDRAVQLAQMAGRPPEVSSARIGPAASVFKIVTAAALRLLAEGVSEADVVFGIGCSFTESSFAIQFPQGQGKRYIHSTIDPVDFNKTVRSELGLVGDAKLVLKAIIAELRKTITANRDATQVVAYTSFTKPDDKDLLKKIDEFLK